MRPGRARAGIVLLAALALASLSLPARASPYHAFDAQTDASSALEFVTETNQRVAQSFAPTASLTLTRAQLYVQDRGNSNVLTVTVVPDGGGRPQETTVLAAATNDTLLLYEWANFTFTPAPALTAGTTYWIVANSGGGNGDGYAWRYADVDRYPRGNAATAVANTWTAQPGDDLAFALFGWTPANVTLAATADRTSTSSGDTIRYAFSLNNTGTEDATDAWVNATLDARLQFVNASGAAVSLSGAVVTFQIAAVPMGGTTLELTATAGSLLPDGDFVVLPVTYEAVGATPLAASVVLYVRAPRVSVELESGPSSVHPGTVVTFAVTVMNDGREVARHVWLNQTLHPSLTYLNDNAPVPADQDGTSQSWHFLNVAPGPTSFNVSAQVDPQAAADTVIANFLSLEYTDRVGGGLARGRSNTVWFSVLGGAASNPWLWGSFAISATIVGGSYFAYARRRLRTEEIFLIHQSGVLLVHMSKTMKSDLDSDILSGMFTAIMNFVRDAFHYDNRQELRGLDLGGSRVHVRKGVITYLALVHSGKPTRWIAKASAQAVQEIETHYGEMLRDWDGDLRSLAGVREILRGHFLSPTGPSRSRTWMRLFFARLDRTFKPMRPL